MTINFDVIDLSSESIAIVPILISPAPISMAMLVRIFKNGLSIAIAAPNSYANFSIY